MRPSPVLRFPLMRDAKGRGLRWQLLGATALIPLGLLPAWGQDCTATNGMNCVIVEQAAQGQTPAALNLTLSGQNYGGEASGYGAIDVQLTSGAGHSTNSTGDNGGGGAVAAAITLDIDDTVTASGATPGSDPTVQFVSRGGTGGHGGHGQAYIVTTTPAGTGGTGGNGANVQGNFDATVESGTTASNVTGLLFLSAGGAGGGDAQTGGGGTYAANGGTGGTGGNITLTSAAGVSAQGPAVWVISSGGAGGNGAEDTGGDYLSQGGYAGAGGTAGEVNLTFTGTATSAAGDALVVTAQGGGGGTGGYAAATTNQGQSNGGKAGNGGAAVWSKATLSDASINAAGDGVSVIANGGTGGTGGGGQGNSTLEGGNGGGGGSAGSAYAVITNGTAVIAAGNGVVATANGGNGGAGGSGSGLLHTKGAQGGDAGGSGLASIALDQSASVTTTGSGTGGAVLAGLLAQSNGGVGGAGAVADAIIGTAGGGGTGGTAGTASADVSGQVTASGAFAYGALVQAVGGAGGSGASAAGIFASGGKGLTGGGGGSAAITGNGGQVATTGASAIGLIAQSVGGGGGSGGHATAVGTGASVAIGGNGGLGGDGAAVNIGDPTGGAAAIDTTVTTTGDEATAMLAQSVGGGGGNGGSAISASGNPVIDFSFSIGGSGAKGGAGGAVVVNNAGLIRTSGTQAGGIAAQSVGGGGGNGGAALSFSTGQMSASTAVGGNGGGGGNGSSVTVTNANQILTSGSDSYGIKAQSVSGGGGEGGASTAYALSLGTDPELPAVAMSVSVGGRGGAGGTAAAATVRNAGFIATAGDGAMAVMVQSVGGGGGNGGDASGWAYAGGDSAANISGDVTIGGTGGSGGTGGAVTATNAALIMTTGESAYGLYGQSVGGGGGQGGKGDGSAGAAQSEDGLSMGGTLTIGGNGGVGSQGGTVKLANLDLGGILTEGDGANAMFGQSIGGGGGAANGGVGKANGGDLSVTVSVGGNGGSGGNGGEVDLANSYALRTAGADADAMIAQSIGGGGGKGGKAASTAGGAEDPKDAARDLANRLNTGLNLGIPVATIDSVIKLGDGVLNEFTDAASLRQIDAGSDSLQALADDDDDGTADNLKLAVTIGGAGGAGGDGGPVSGYNEGVVTTTGAKSDAIFVQSVGGGGGAGGAASHSASSGKKSVTLTVGAAGSGGKGGQGGSATITNAAQAQVYTTGLAANGLVAQSIGGGGGKGGAAAAKGGGLDNVTVALGGNGGAFGAGGTVTVNTDVSAYVETQGKNAIAILAQSVGGGGGIAHLLDKDETNPAGGAAKANSADDFDIAFSFGGNGGSSGAGGNVIVQSQVASVSNGLGKVSTQGRNAYGILAQSIGGGGGIAAGGQVSGSNTLFNYQGSPGAGGDGGTVTVNYQGVLTTGGDGATGIWAQSVGGGGGIAGDTAQSATATGFGNAGQGQPGNGGAVSVDVENATLTTTSANAPVIHAQSIGGGGGHVTTLNGAYTGSAGGAGTGSTVDVEIGTTSGPSTLAASGKGSAAVMAQSAGGSGRGAVTVNIGAKSVLTGSADTAAILIEGSDASVVNNAGFVHGEGGGVIATTAGTSVTLTNNAGGWLYGNISAGPNGTFVNNGEFQSNTVINAPDVENNRDMGIGLSNAIPTTLTINGNIDNNDSGTIYADVNFTTRATDQLVVTGSANISGTIYVQPIELVSASGITVVSSPELTSLDGFTVTGTGANVYKYSGDYNGATISVGVDASFAGPQLTGNQTAVAGHLQAIWDAGGTGFGRQFAAIARADEAGGYAGTLDALSGQGKTAIGASRHLASHQFVNQMNSCPDFGSPGSYQVERDCTWGRVIGGGADRAGTAGQAGYDWTSTTVQIGGQRQLDSGIFLGASIAYENSHLDLDAGGGANGQGVLIGLIAKRQLGNWLLSGAADLGFGWYDADRPVDAGGIRGTAHGAPDTRQFGLHGRIAYQMPRGEYYLKPYVDLHATYTHTDGFDETGGTGFGLAYDDADDLKFAVAPMLELGGQFTAGRAKVSPFAAVGAVFYDDNDWSTSARFLGAPAGTGGFTTLTDQPETVARLNLGLRIAASDAVQIRLEYQGEFARDYRWNAAALKVSYEF